VKTLLVAMIALCAFDAQASEPRPIMHSYERVEIACVNFIAAQGAPLDTLAYVYVKKLCLEVAFDDPGWITEWSAEREAPTARTTPACEAQQDLKSCLAMELEKLER